MLVGPDASGGGRLLVPLVVPCSRESRLTAAQWLPAKKSAAINFRSQNSIGPVTYLARLAVQDRSGGSRDSAISRLLGRPRLIFALSTRTRYPVITCQTSERAVVERAARPRAS